MHTQNHGYKLKIGFKVKAYFKAVPSVPKEVPILNDFTVPKFISSKKDF